MDYFISKSNQLIRERSDTIKQIIDIYSEFFIDEVLIRNLKEDLLRLDKGIKDTESKIPKKEIKNYFIKKSELLRKKEKKISEELEEVEENFELETKEDFVSFLRNVLHKNRELQKDCDLKIHESRSFVERKSIPKSLRIAVWEKRFGKSYRGNCFVCGRSKIETHNFELGHVIAKKKDGKDKLDNLEPICSTCNKSMGTQNLYEFKEKVLSNTQ